MVVCFVYFVLILLKNAVTTGLPNSEKDETMTWEVQTNDLKGVVNKLIPGSIGKDIEKACPPIYRLHDVFVRKVKILKNPRFELGKECSWSFMVKEVILEELPRIRRV